MTEDPKPEYTSHMPETNLDRFAKSAIEGGWMCEPIKLKPIFRKIQNEIAIIGFENTGAFADVPMALLLLDPKAWEAVGKVQGWEGLEDAPAWAYKMHLFVDGLIKGSSKERALDMIL